MELKRLEAMQENLGRALHLALTNDNPGVTARLADNVQSIINGEVGPILREMLEAIDGLKAEIEALKQNPSHPAP